MTGIFSFQITRTVKAREKTESRLLGLPIGVRFVLSLYNGHFLGDWWGAIKKNFKFISYSVYCFQNYCVMSPLFTGIFPYWFPADHTALEYFELFGCEKRFELFNDHLQIYRVFIVFIVGEPPFFSFIERLLY